MIGHCGKESRSTWWGELEKAEQDDFGLKRSNRHISTRRMEISPVQRGVSPVFNHGHRLVVSLSLNPLIPLRLLPLEQYSAIQQIKHGWTTLRLVCPHPLPDLPEDNIATPKGLVYKLRPS